MIATLLNTIAIVIIAYSNINRVNEIHTRIYDLERKIEGLRKKRVKYTMDQGGTILQED